MHFNKPNIIFLLTLLFIIPCAALKAQNVTSPYSILGIGDIDTKDYGRYFSEGSTAISRRDPYSYNFSNPASITSLPEKVMNFDIATRGRISNFQLPGTDTTTSVSKDFAVKRVTMAFKISKKTGIAFGLRPYSSVNYQFQSTQAILDGNSYYTKSVEGDGGVNQVYFSIARELGKNFSAGLTTSYLFGSLEKTTNYTSTYVPLNITKLETTSLYGASVQGGLQFYSSENRKWRHQVGLTATVNTSLNGQFITDYTDNSSSTNVIKEEVANDQSFKLPMSLGFGYSAISNDKLIFSADVNYSNWPYQVVNYTNSYTNSTFRVSGGIEYSKKITYGSVKAEKYYIAVGASAENSYLMINNNYLKDYSFTLGGGINVSRNLSIYGGIESGVKGDINSQQIKENYTSFLIGFSLKELWYGTKRFGKFY